MKELSISMTQQEKAYGWFYFAFEFFLLPSVLQSINILMGKPFSMAVINVVYFAINFGCTGYIFRSFLRNSFDILRQKPGKIALWAGILLPIYFAGCWVCSQVAFLLRPDFANLNDQSIAGMMQESYWLMCIGTVLLVPMAEELLFRGLIFRGLYNKSRMLAYAASTIAFAAVHVVSFIGKYDLPLMLLSLLQYLPAGICLGFAYAKTDTICTPILMHITINLIGVFLVM